MFRFSIDEFINKTQQEKVTAFLTELSKSFIVEHCPEIEKFFDDYVTSYEFLEEIPKLSNPNEKNVSIVCVPYDTALWRANADLREVCEKINKSQQETIPFIEFSFPENYKCKHGEPYKHVFIFFVTKFNSFEDSKNYTIYYLNKLNKLRAFL